MLIERESNIPACSAPCGSPDETHSGLEHQTVTSSDVQDDCGPACQTVTSSDMQDQESSRECTQDQCAASCKASKPSQSMPKAGKGRNTTAGAGVGRGLLQQGWRAQPELGDNRLGRQPGFTGPGRIYAVTHAKRGTAPDAAVKRLKAPEGQMRKDSNRTSAEHHTTRGEHKSAHKAATEDMDRPMQDQITALHTRHGAQPEAAAVQPESVERQVQDEPHLALWSLDPLHCCVGSSVTLGV